MTDRITRKVIIDTDPSADDAVALMLAMASPELEILGMTAAFGVCDSARSIKNIMKIQTLCGREEIPAVQGAEMPLVRRMEFDDAYCGCDGLSQTDLPDPKKKAEPGEAWRFMAEMVKRFPGEVSIISLAPMTNLALMIQNDPAAADAAAGIYTIAGSYGLRPDYENLNPRAEWNLAQDPEAAAVVFGSGIPIMAAGLDVTRRLDNSMMERLLAAAKEGKKTGFLRRAVQFNINHGLEPYSLLVDSAAVCLALCPEIVKTVSGHVMVETKGEHTTGQILFGNSGRFKKQGSQVQAAWDYDWDRLLDFLEKRVFS